MSRQLVVAPALFLLTGILHTAVLRRTPVCRRPTGIAGPSMKAVCDLACLWGSSVPRWWLASAAVYRALALERVTLSGLRWPGGRYRPRRGRYIARAAVALLTDIVAQLLRSVRADAGSPRSRPACRCWPGRAGCRSPCRKRSTAADRCCRRGVRLVPGCS